MFFSKFLIEYKDQKVTLAQEFLECLFQGNNYQAPHD